MRSFVLSVLLAAAVAAVIWRVALGPVYRKVQYILAQPVRVSPEWGRR